MRYFSSLVIARVDPDDFVNLSPAAALQKKINRHAEEDGIAQDGRDVFKDDAFLWKIQHVAYAGAQFFDNIGTHRPDASGLK